MYIYAQYLKKKRRRNSAYLEIHPHSITRRAEFSTRLPPSLLLPSFLPDPPFPPSLPLPSFLPSPFQSLSPRTKNKTKIHHIGTHAYA